MDFDIYIPPPIEISATMTGAWERKWKRWIWSGVAVAAKPIVAVSLIRAANRIEWARSNKLQSETLAVELDLYANRDQRTDVGVYFLLGGNGARRQTRLDDPDQHPELPLVSDVPIGKPFLFCPPFGTPKLELWGLLLLREQAVCARVGIWHLRKCHRASVPPDLRRLLTYGRYGSFEERPSA